MIKDNIFSDVSDEELMELYQEYRIMTEEETERPLCSDQIYPAVSAPVRFCPGNHRGMEYCF